MICQAEKAVNEIEAKPMDRYSWYSVGAGAGALGVVASCKYFNVGTSGLDRASVERSLCGARCRRVEAKEVDWAGSDGERALVERALVRGAEANDVEEWETSDGAFGEGAECKSFATGLAGALDERARYISESIGAEASGSG